MNAADPAEDRSKYARKRMGFTATVLVRMHPDLHARMAKVAARRYQTDQEYIRQALLAQLERDEGS